MMADSYLPSTTAHITATTPLAPTIEAWKIYLDDQGRSPHTVKAFTADLQLMASYLPPDRALGNIVTQDINLFLQWMQNNRGVPCSPKSLARRITSIKAFFRWLHQAGVLLIDPAEKVLQQSVMSPLPMILSPEEVDTILEVANRYRTTQKPDSRPYTLLALLLETGIKKGESLELSPNHIDFDSPNGPFIFIRYTNPRNRYKERKIPISENWIAAYHEYTAQYHPEDNIFPWSPRRLEYLLEDIGEEAGLDKHLSFDMCRWTCAVNDWISGMETEMIRQKMGVSKIQWREISLKLRQLAGQHPTTT